MVKKIKLISSLFAIMACAFVAGAAPLTAIVPAYFYPSPIGSDWDSIGVGLDSGASIITIMNPASGPGAAFDQNYANAVNNLRSKGGKVIAYVPTTYAQRPAGQVKQDIDTYLNWYNIDGFFLDETLGDGVLSTLQYYSEIYHYVKNINSSLLVVGNTGNDATSLYLWWPVVDVLVTYEGFSWDYYSDSVPSWRGAFSSDHFAMIVHTLVATPAEFYMNEITDIARSRNTKYVYVTDDTFWGNPFDQLPSFWWQFMFDIIYR